MAFLDTIPRPEPRGKAKARHIFDIHDALTGVLAQPFSFTADHPTLAALKVRQKNSLGPIFFVYNGDDDTGKLFEVSRTNINAALPINASGIGTLTSSANMLSLGGGFNNTGATFRGIYINLAAATADANSCLEEFVVGGVTKWKVGLDGTLLVGDVGKVATATSADYATTAGNADTVDGKHAAATGNGVIPVTDAVTGKLNAAVIPTTTPSFPHVQKDTTTQHVVSNGGTVALSEMAYSVATASGTFIVYGTCELSTSHSDTHAHLFVKVNGNTISTSTFDQMGTSGEGIFGMMHVAANTQNVTVELQQGGNYGDQVSVNNVHMHSHFIPD